MNQGNFDPKLEKLYEILKRKKQIIFYGPPGTGKTYSANKLKKYILSKNTPQPISSNSKNWIYSVDPENWEIVKTHHIWASSVPIEKIRERINQNDNVIFFVTGTKKFQGIFKFSSDWYTAESVVWPDETNEVRYLSQIKLEPILLGDLNLWDIAKNLEYFPDPENKRDSSLKLQGRGGYPSNKESLSRKDFETICSHMRSIGSSTNDQNFSKNVTFHQSYSYEDFVEGIRPDITSSDKVIYKPQDGIFKEICESARKDPQNNYVLTIDEINRGNVSKIFGELITLIESDKRKEEHKVTLPYTRQSFWIPKNLFIIGTMNTADRSIAQLDTALRRRFAFEELMPEYTLKDLDKSIDGISLKDLLSTLNSRIRDQGPQFRDKQIGHSYFMDDCKNIEDLRTIFAVEIIP
ncbi:MAG: AAA domain-containing protein, partial [Candidatus Nitrosopelagicus sp.]|nr:AAA domain-containing protein [Candidatus Nitrosopelagicus sp.]